MVDTKTTVQSKQASKQKPEDPRAKLRENRAHRLKMIKGDRPARSRFSPRAKTCSA